MERELESIVIALLMRTSPLMKSRVSIEEEAIFFPLPYFAGFETKCIVRMCRCA